MIAAFDLSYRALEPDHQRFFRRLGVSPCAAVSLPAAAALGGCTLAEAEKALGALLDYHLLARAPDGQFRFHDLIRGYAAVRAAREDPRPSSGRPSAGCSTTTCTPPIGRPGPAPVPAPAPVQVSPSAGRGPALGTQEDAAAWLESEWRNILQAARYAGGHEWKQKCADLAGLLADFMEIRAYWGDASPRTPWPCRPAVISLTRPGSRRRPWRSVRCASRPGGEAAIALAEEAGGDLPDNGRPERRGRLPRPDRPGSPAHSPFP